MELRGAYVADEIKVKQEVEKVVEKIGEVVSKICEIEHPQHMQHQHMHPL